MNTRRPVVVSALARSSDTGSAWVFKPDRRKGVHAGATGCDAAFQTRNTIRCFVKIRKRWPGWTFPNIFAIRSRRGGVELIEAV